MDGSNQAPNWQYQVDDEGVAPYVPHVLEPTSVATPPRGEEGTISWTASEFIAHQKTLSWYVTLAGCAVLASIVGWFIADMITAIFILIAATLFGILAGRQPRELIYTIDAHGLTVGMRHFEYGDLRSFSVMHEGAFTSITFMPLKRFAQSVTIYYDPQDEPKIIDLLSNYLPHEVRTGDPIDRLMWRIRF